MELDDMKQAWTAQFAGVEQRLATLERHLGQGVRQRLRLTLLPSALVAALEGAIAALALVAVATVLSRHGADPRYLLGGGAAGLVLLGVAVLAVVRLDLCLRLDLAQPVVVIQRDVARLRRVELGATAWALFGGIVVWLPVPLLLLEAVTGAAVLARVDLPYLAANLAFGVLVAVAAAVVARRIAASPRLRPWLARAADAMSGRGLRRTSAQLAELEQFARGE